MNRVLRALLASLFNVVDAIREHVNGASIIAEPELGEANRHPIGTLEPETEQPTMRKTRKRGRGRRSMVVYVVRKGAKTVKPLGDSSTLQPTEIDVLRAVKNAGATGISAFDIEKATGHGKKSVESAVWRLRKEHTLIESKRT